MRLRRIGATLLLVALVTPMAQAPGATAAGPIPAFDHIFVIVLENHSYNEIIGNAAAPYLNSLATQYGLATQYHAIRHPSLPNYLALTGGSTFGITNDCNTCYLNAPNIAVDRVEASGRTWKAYMESMPAPCTLGDTALYVQHHDPFVYYDNIRTNPAECNKVVPYTSLAGDLASVSTTPDFGWITPNVCNDMHSCSVATGDAWMQANVPAILGSPAFTTQNSLLTILFDEDDGTQGNQVATILVGPSVTPGFHSGVSYDHYSFLKTIEAAWGLAPLATSDANATPMADFFGPPAPAAAADTFTRTVANGWGAAETGGPWTLGTAATNYQVNGTAGTMQMPTAGGGANARLLAQSLGDADLRVRVSADKVATGSGQWGALIARRVSFGNEYRIRLRFLPNTTIALSVSKVVAGAETLVGLETVVAGLAYTPNTFYDLHAQVNGTNPTTLRARTWLDGLAEPATWQLSRTESTAALQNPGAPGLWSYLSGTSTNAPVTYSFDDYTAQSLALPPTAAFTVSCTNLTCAADGTTSTTQQPPITAYSWNWGDGAITAGATSNHTYSAAGAYGVVLTVTDSVGLQGTATQNVSPTNPLLYAADAFTRTVANGWGVADTGGSWTLGTAATGFQVNGSAGTMLLANANTGANARLLSQSLGDANLYVRVSANKVATGSGQWSAIVARRVSTGNEYRARLRFLSNNTVAVSISRVVAGAETLVGTEVVVSGLAYTPNTFYVIHAQVTGTNPTTIRVRAWLDGLAEPATWQLAQTDSTAALQNPGAPGLWSYLSATSTNAPVTYIFDDFNVLP